MVASQAQLLAPSVKLNVRIYQSQALDTFYLNHRSFVDVVREVVEKNVVDGDVLPLAAPLNFLRIYYLRSTKFSTFTLGLFVNAS